MISLTISVPDDLRDFVDRRARETQHASPTEYVEELIREDQRRVEHQRLEELMLEGLDSGQPIQITDLDSHFAQKKNALLSRINRATRQ